MKFIVTIFLSSIVSAFVATICYNALTPNKVKAYAPPAKTLFYHQGLYLSEQIDSCLNYLYSHPDKTLVKLDNVIAERSKDSVIFWLVNEVKEPNGYSVQAPLYFTDPDTEPIYDTVIPANSKDTLFIPASKYQH